MKKLAVLLFALAACGGRQTTTTTPEASEAETRMRQLREAAAANPGDARLWAQLAELELLGEAGDAANARAAVDHALSIAPSPALRARLSLVSAWEHELHCRPPEALSAYVATLEAARQAPADPATAAAWAPLYAEIALDGIREARGGVPHFDATVGPVLERALGEPGSLGHPAIDAAAIGLMGLRERAGDDDAEEAMVARLGCLTEWRASGPYGPYVNMSFDERHPAQGAGPMEGEFDVRPGVMGQAPFEGEADGCRLTFAPEEDAGPGTTVAETFVEVASAGPKLLRIDTGASFHLFVDGERVHTLDRRGAIHPSYVFVPLELTAGRHEIELVMTTYGRAPTATVALDWAGRLGEDYEPSRGVAIPEPSTPLETLVVAHTLQGRGDAVHAAALVGRGDGGPLASAAMLVHRADLLGDEPYIPSDQQQQLQAMLLRHAHERDPEALIPAVREVARQEDPNAVFEGFLQLRDRYPAVVQLRSIYANMLEERGRPREAEAELRSIIAAFPEECGPVESLRRLLRQSGHHADANALVDDLMTCDATSTARLGLLMEQREWEQAAAELERLKPFVEEKPFRAYRLQLAIQRGDEATEQAIRAEILEENPDSRVATLRHVDRAIAEGRQSRALGLLDEAADRDPNGMEGLRNLRRDLTGRDDMEAFRIDGAEVLAEYQSEGDPYPDAPQVLVLDYMVSRIYPDGSARHLVHQITRVQSEEAKDRLGQYQPRGRMLTLRTIKPDGRRLEPERISGVDSIPLTELAVGDYVEEEYILTGGPRLNGGFLSAGWSFSSTVQPFHRSEMIAVVPDGVELVVETTGDVPEPTEERRRGERVVRWSMEQVPIREAEPDTVPLPPTWPTLQFGWQAGWEAHFLAERDYLMNVNPSHPLGRAVCTRLTRGAENREEAVGRVVTWVHDRIEPGEGWGSAGPAMLYAERGHQTRVAHYLLRECGIDAEIGVVRGVHSEQPGELAGGSIYDNAVIVVAAEDGGAPLVVSVGNRDASWRWLPSPIRGQEAILLSEGFPVVPIPDPGPEADLRRYSVDVNLGEGGTATVEVTERHVGLPAAVWRRTFREVPAAELDRLLEENYVGRLFPGSEVRDLAIGSGSDRSQPVQLSFVVDVPAFGRPAGNAVLLPNVFQANLAQGLAQLPSRDTTLGVGSRALEVVTTIRGIAAADRTAQLLTPVQLEGFGGSRYERRARVQDGALVVIRRLVLPETNVPPEAYAEFAAFCRAVSAAEVPEIPVIPASAAQAQSPSPALARATR